MPAQESPIVVASAVDRTYLPLIEVVAASIAASTTAGRRVEYHILYSGPPSWLVGHLRRFRRGPVTIHVHEIENPWERFGVINGFPPAALLRFSLEDALPPNIARVIYLDADVIVQRDLGPLFDLPMNGHAVAAAVDVEVVARMYGESGPAATEYLRETLSLGDAADTYLQSGVMVFDLPASRQLGLRQKVTVALERLGHNLKYADQCAANAVLKGDYEILDPRWNARPGVADISADPWIIHFAYRKPWLWLGLPGGDRWWAVARSTLPLPIHAWRYMRYHGRREIEALKRRLRRRLNLT
jgi:lipopolysaccharide biosynthesis glycosyltransferase